MTTKPEAAPATIETRTVKLSKPIQSHNGEVRELVLKDPGAAIMLKVGLPWREIWAPTGEASTPSKMEVEFLPDRMAAYLEAMTGLDRITLGEIPARDMNACFTHIFMMLQPASF